MNNGGSPECRVLCSRRLSTCGSDHPMRRLAQAFIAQARHVLMSCHHIPVMGASRTRAGAEMPSIPGRRVVMASGAVLIVLTLDESLIHTVQASWPDTSRPDPDAAVLSLCTGVMRVVAKDWGEGVRRAAPPIVVDALSGVSLPDGVKVEEIVLDTGCGVLRAAVIGIVEAAPVHEAPRLSHALVIDDDPLVRKLFSKVLGDAGIEVSTAADGRQGIDMLAECDPDIVLLDFEMPGMSGLECLPEIRRLSPRSRVIMLTARGSVDTVRECVAKGAAAFISKTCKPADLRRHVKQLLSREPVCTV